MTLPYHSWADLKEYPFVLRADGLIVYLRLPIDLTRADVDRITRMLDTLIIPTRDKP